MKIFNLLTLAIATLSVASVNAQDLYGTGYTIIGTEKKGDDLKLPIYKRINAYNVQTALNQILNDTGWRLADVQNSDPEIMRLFNQPYPASKHEIGPMALDEALRWVSGNAWELVVDPVNRLVSFEVSQRYQCLPSTLKECP